MKFRRSQFNIGEKIVSKAWLARVRISDFSVKEYCIDSVLVEYLSKSYRRPIFIYPEAVCKHSYPGGLRILPGGRSIDDLLEYIVQGCKDALSIVESLSGRVRPSIARFALLRGMSETEEELNEATQALSLCKLLFGDKLSYELLGGSPRYIVYDINGKETQDKRLNSLMRIDPLFRERIANFLGKDS